jgi:hypothetical protein
VPTYLPDELRAKARNYNAFGGSDDLEDVMTRAASAIEYYELRLLQFNRLLVEIKQHSETVGNSLIDTAGLISEAIW